MLVTTLSDFRKNIKRYLANVTQKLETLIIDDEKDDGVVIMSKEEYNSFRATHHELSSKTNQKRMDSAIEKLTKDASFKKDLLN